MKDNRIKYDYETNKWFNKRPLIQTTVVQCEKCRLFYKPSLGHNCKYKLLENKKEFKE